MTERLRVLVADDELMARRRLLRLLGEMENVDAVGECESGAEVLARIAREPIDVVLLDIHMPGLSGLETLRIFAEHGPYVVFCTAHPQHALEAFDAGAIDYVLKPVEADRLAKALERARSREARQRFRNELARHPSSVAVASPDAAAPTGETRPQQAHAPRSLAWNRIPITTRKGIVLLDPGQISHAVLEGELVTVVSQQGTYLTDASLQELESRLSASFLRVHRRALLNLDHVVCLEPNDAGGFVARTQRGDAVVVSRQAARELRRLLGLRAKPDAPPDR